MSREEGPETRPLRRMMGRIAKPIDRQTILVEYMTMIQVDIAEAKTHLSKYLRKVEQGATVVLARRNRPVAEIRRVRPRRRGRRPIGLCEGEFIVPAKFDAPLPEELLDAFEGR
ncbi:MAG TPA: type II toxin-antitoxin system prevent-host-death family antitoxin [Vicinamibacteria bacterium]|nr:type II toxin-antitoxin system prevent-host-death family antitoxin [Vicinamibacteria bacterium]